jgi:hypothetical protein
VTQRALTSVTVLLSIAGAIAGWIVAFGAWGVGYCGGLTPDSPEPETLRSTLCRGASGNVMGGVVVASGLLAAAAPFAGRWLARRKHRSWPLAACTIAGAVPLAAIVILATTLPQG